MMIKDDENYAVLLGTVLGDGYLQATGKENARLKLEHSKKQEQYLLWKVDKFIKLGLSGRISYLERKHPKTESFYHYVRYQSNTNKTLGDLRKFIYPEGTKKIAPFIERFLTPMMFTTWYLDDGHYSERDRSAFLYFSKVTNEEALIIKHTVDKLFDVDVSLYDKKSKGFAINFKRNGTIKLFNQINELIPNCMSYKHRS